MNAYRDWAPANDQRPITWVRGYPVYVVHVIVATYTVLMVLTALLGGGANGLLGWTAFDSARIWSGEVWRLATYGLFNPPSLTFVLDMVMLLWFGRELERQFGRMRFGVTYAGIYLVPALVLTLLGLVRPTVFVGQPGSLALFVAFATLLPGVMMLFNITAQAAALILVGLYALMSVAERNWTALTMLGSTCGFAFLAVRQQQGLLRLPRLRLPRRKPQLRVLPDLPPAPARKSLAPQPVPGMSDVDALLDKIAAHGLASLTTAERARLEAARADLLKRGGRR
jgi:membrane associated rhomboid family serine protease